jgi:ribosomal protein S18 acetylase RimI-like enzyme
MTEIRRAVRGDAACLAELNAAVHALHVAARPDVFKPSDRASLCVWFEALLDNPRARVWVAAELAALVGYLVLVEHERAESVFCFARHWCEIDQIGVEPEQRGRGIGSALLRTALAAAAESGVHEVEIASWAFNTSAHALFRRCGFETRMLRFEMRSG